MLTGISRTFKKVLGWNTDGFGPASECNSQGERKRSMVRRPSSEVSGEEIAIPIKRRRLEQANGLTNETSNGQPPNSVLKRLSDYISWMLNIPGNVSLFTRFRRAVVRSFGPSAMQDDPDYSDEETASQPMAYERAAVAHGDGQNPRKVSDASLLRTPLHPDHWSTLQTYVGSHPSQMKPAFISEQDSLSQDRDAHHGYKHDLRHSQIALSQQMQDQFSRQAHESMTIPKLHQKHQYNFASNSASYVSSRVHMGKTVLPSGSGINEKQATNGFYNAFCHSSVVQSLDRSSSDSSQSTTNLHHSARKRLHGATLKQCIRLQEKEQYRMMLQRYTFEPLLRSSQTRQPNVSHLQQRPHSQNKSIILNEDSVQETDMPAFFAERLDRRSSHNISHRIRAAALPSDPYSFVGAVSKRKTPEETPLPSVNGISWRKEGMEQNRKSECNPLETPGTSSNGISWSKGPKESIKQNGSKNRRPFMRKSAAPFPSYSDSGLSSSPSFSSARGRGSGFFSETWLRELKQSLQSQQETTKKAIKQGEERVQSFQQKREAEQASLQAKIRENLKTKSFEVSDDLLDIVKEEDVSADFPELSPEMEEAIDEALRPVPPDEVITEGFHLSIRRRDMETLAGLNWLNDEIINFYMNLLMERGKLDNYPSVYAFNTFFYPKLMSGGHQALKRWTRKIDVFSYDFIVIPVHLGMHWCLAVVNFKEKKLQYYDSMGGKNMECLQALRSYLQDESLDKKKEEMDTTDWVLETVKDIPHQMNGSDCGMFACKYAEYVTRRAKINFTQADMPYFRRRMVYEIMMQQLL